VNSSGFEFENMVPPMAKYVLDVEMRIVVKRTAMKGPTPNPETLFLRFWNGFPFSE
jgi:hypothetical protein